MAEKRYYWLKLQDEFFRDKPIKKLRKLAGGDTYTIIYLKMLLKAISQENRLFYEGVEETFAAELALELDEDEDNVAVTLKYLQSKGLLEVMNEEEFLLIQCDEMVGTETDAARRKRMQRERERAKGILGTPPPLTLPEKSKKETQLDLYDRLVIDYQLPDTVREKMKTWFKYKTEKKEVYKEQGMKSLLKMVQSNCEKYGENRVSDLIDFCMANNYKGIIWKIIVEQSQQKGMQVQNRVSEVDNW